MFLSLFIASINIFLLNIGFLLAYLIRYGLTVPNRSFTPYKSSFLVLTLIYMASFSFLSLYKKRFKSSWELFTKVFLGLFIGTLVCVAFVYVFRLRLGAFPTSVFVISSGINLFLIFKINQIILKAKKRIKKQVIIIGNGKVDDIINKKAIVERKRIEDIKELQQYQYIHEIIISEKINAKENLNFLLYIAKKHNTQIYFSSSVYMAILREKLNGENSLHFLSTFVGRKTDLDELLIRATDLFGSLIFLLVFVPVMLFISLLIETTSEGPVLYKQKRVGKDGKTFIIFKFRTMKNNTGKQTESESAKKDDPRVTTVGKLLRPTRLDELPQLFNVLKGDMSLVGPRPENLSRVEKHAALRGLRLAVKPGLTGLAQIRSFYDIEPKHKIKYDYLYIQRRSLALNFYILLQTVPVVLTKKGW